MRMMYLTVFVQTCIFCYLWSSKVINAFLKLTKVEFSLPTGMGIM